jgi:hypothetical protein
LETKRTTRVVVHNLINQIDISTLQVLTFVTPTIMSNPNMVAVEGSQGSVARQTLPPIDSDNVEHWMKVLVLYLMAHKRSHLGLRSAPVQAGQAAAAHQKALENWKERNDTCVSSIYLACAGNTDALEIADQYLLEKEILDEDDADKDPEAKELLKRLHDKFKLDEIDELIKVQGYFTDFVLASGEKVCSGVDRLNGIVQKLTNLGQPPTAETKLTKLKKAIHIPSLRDLWLNIAMVEQPDYATISKKCKSYDHALNEEADAKQEVNFSKTVSDPDKKKDQICSYCDKKGHVNKHCFVKKADNRKAQFKKGARGGDKEKEARGGNKELEGRQKPGSKVFTGCYKCGSKKHIKEDCTKKYKDKNPRPDQNPREFKSSKKSHGASRYVNESESEEDSGDEVDMIGDCDVVGSEENEVLFTDAYEGKVFLDSCASRKLFLVQDQSCVETFEPRVGNIQTTRSGPSGVLSTQGVGASGHWNNITICNNAIKNLVGGGYLRTMGYGLTLLQVPRIVKLCDGAVVLVAEYSQNGMPFVDLMDLFALPNIGGSQSGVGGHACGSVLLSDNMDRDPIELLHERTAHCSKSVLIQAYKRDLFKTPLLNRTHLSKKN